MQRRMRGGAHTAVRAGVRCEVRGAVHHRRCNLREARFLRLEVLPPGSDGGRRDPSREVIFMDTGSSIQDLARMVVVAVAVLCSACAAPPEPAANDEPTGSTQQAITNGDD